MVELGDGELVYIRLDDDKKYLLDGSGCWRCGSTANCFGNMIDDDKLDIICEFDFYDEVRSLFLCLLQDRVNRIASRLSERTSRNISDLIERFVDSSTRVIEQLNVKKCSHYIVCVCHLP